MPVNGKVSATLLRVEVIAKRVHEARRNRGFSQFRLATEMGDYTRQMVSRVEQGKSTTSTESLLAAAKALGVSTDYLFGLTDDPTPATALAEKVGELADEAALAVSPEIRKVPGARPIPVHRLQSAAGGGAVDLDETIKTYAYFRQEWLSRKRLIPNRCNIINVMGESMEPTLPDGCVILLDRNRTRRLPGHIFVVRTEDGLIVKRAGKDKDGGWQLVSDHPSWKPVPWPDGAEVLGEVKWMAREL